MKKDFYDKPLYTIPNYILGFFLSSFYLAICNILLILFFIFTAIAPNNFNLLLLFISLIPLGPSLSALYAAIGKLILDKDIYFSSYFWSFYKHNFVSYLKLWLIELIAIAILFIDFEYFYFNMPEKRIHIIFAILIIISLLIGFYSSPINSRFEIKSKDLFLLSIYYVIKKFPISILKVAVVIFTYYLSNNISLIFLIFMPSIICFIFFYYDKIIFTEIKDRFLSSDCNNIKAQSNK